MHTVPKGYVSEPQVHLRQQILKSTPGRDKRDAYNMLNTRLSITQSISYYRANAPCPSLVSYAASNASSHKESGLLCSVIRSLSWFFMGSIKAISACSTKQALQKRLSPAHYT
jgi:hypothetical protein